MTLRDHVTHFVDSVNRRAKAMPPGIAAGVHAECTEVPVDGEGTSFTLTITMDPFSEASEVTASRATVSVDDDHLIAISLERGGIMEAQDPLPGSSEGLTQLREILQAWAAEVCPDLTPAQSAPAPSWACTSCGAVWTQGQFTEECAECGGGAMERPCLICDGRCGAAFKRMPMDSNDYREAHWLGGCKLPQNEQMEWMQRKIEEFKRLGGTGQP